MNQRSCKISRLTGVFLLLSFTVFSTSFAQDLKAFRI